jgi:hypothetical protein
LNNGIEFSGLMALLKEKEAFIDVPGYEKTEFTQFAGGLKLTLISSSLPSSILPRFP